MNKKHNILIVAACRPNFMKVAPLLKEMEKFPTFNPILLQIKQHNDDNMTKVFFQDLNIREPDRVCSMDECEIARTINSIRPDMTIVVGDVNASRIAATVSDRINIPVAHVEAGLRSFDITMPEETNRIVIDSCSKLLFCSEWSGCDNLIKEGYDKDRIHWVGQIMIDTLLNNHTFKPSTERYAVLTLHRPSNVDCMLTLINLIGEIKKVTEKINVKFPIHPRTKNKFKEFGIDTRYFDCMEPLGYHDFIGLISNAKFIMTDSGGIQEEATVLKVPCLTLRKNTERPSTIMSGGNVLIGDDYTLLHGNVIKILSGQFGEITVPRLWDGYTAERIVQELIRYFGG